MKRKAVSVMLPADWPNASGIYKIFFHDPNLFYIGSAINMRIRWSLHLRQLQKETHHNIHLQRAYAKYGLESLHFEVVEQVERKENLIEREQYYLDTLNPHFNISKNAKNMLGLKHTEESKEKNRIAHLGKAPPNKGKPMGEEQRQFLKDLYKDKGIAAGINTRFQKGRISQNKGKQASLETRAKISKVSIERNAVLALQNITPEQKIARHKKSRDTIRNMTHERKAEMYAKREATKAANRLANPKWSRKYAACIECGTIANRHAAYGLCKVCYAHKYQEKSRI